MKGAQGYTDLGLVFDEIFEAARNFSDEFQRNLGRFGSGGPASPPRGGFGENIDYYPNYSYPPMNVYMTQECSLVFEFALAGFSEKDVSLSFQGDYMLFSAATPEDTGAGPADENVRYFKRRLKLKNIERQKYYVPLDKYAQEKVKAVFKNGILRVIVPPKDEPDQSGIKIEIVSGD
ncbi:MAG: Hsp20/alpha crystallin family protein [Treponema sp.]|jgi:HSP20 family molecular chaperone IbpA|nr:Hsp20/alpha crystallin family protein [Treponema sp.]